MQSIEAISDDLRLNLLPASPDYAWLAGDLRMHKADAVKEGDEERAKLVWCLEHTADTQRLYLQAYAQLDSGAFYEAWCTLEQVELCLMRLGRHFRPRWGEYRLDFIERVTGMTQSLYPYRMFMSPEILELKKVCSICEQPVSLKNPCGHVVGEIYEGENCGRIVKECEFLGMAFVRDPVQKYSVPFLNDPATGRAIDQYNYRTVEYLMKRWRDPFKGWEATWTTKLHPIEKWGRIGRNEQCPCESGKKYKRCCLGLGGIMRPHVEFRFFFPVPPHLQTEEFTY